MFRSITTLKNKKNKNEKSPETDGLQAEFYHYFWKELHDDMIHSFNLSLTVGHYLSETGNFNAYSKTE